ncbi:hypothetical protein NCCP1664_25190 [Zafaria cholistanensis]|uniref:Uncharacterized protein n=1 Tax=Zafaria cholistanensis TaxID=1682741 RepID=A0A5A7NT04_9MICC|nr:hypothetical protein [Zafaria cholistanensis]GER24024.1 hypothetical protein NCCP1664_25190 [Zafaria cholistanensis]
MRRAAGRISGEDGRILVLAAGYVSIALLAVSATLAATAVTTEARRLLSVADGAATAAADRYTVAQGPVERQGPAGSQGQEGMPGQEGTQGRSGASGPVNGSVGLVLTDTAVRAAALEYARDVGAPERFDGFAVLTAGADPAGTTARIRLGATVRPPIVGWFVPAGIPISVESSARTILTR